MAFSKVNDCAYRVDTPIKRGAGWLMEVAWPGGKRVRWIARVGNRASDPMSFDDARAVAAAMARTRDDGKPRDWIKELNLIAAAEVDRTDGPYSPETPLPGIRLAEVA